MVLLSFPLVWVVLTIISHSIVTHLNILLIDVQLLLWLLSIQQDSLCILHLDVCLISVLLRACIGTHVLGTSKRRSSPRWLRIIVLVDTAGSATRGIRWHLVPNIQWHLYSLLSADLLLVLLHVTAGDAGHWVFTWPKVNLLLLPFGRIRWLIGGAFAWHVHGILHLQCCSLNQLNKIWEKVYLPHNSFLCDEKLVHFERWSEVE